MPETGQHATCKCNNAEYHVAYGPDKQTMLFTIWRNGPDGCEVNSENIAENSNWADIWRGTGIERHAF